MDIHLNLTSETVEQGHLYKAHEVRPDVPLREVLQTMKADRRGSVLVCKDGILQGIFTERDALRLLASGAELEQPISAVMTRNPVTLPREATVAEAIQKMSQGGYRRLPIVDEDGRPLGVVKVSGLIRYLVQHFPGAVYNLPPDPQMAMPEREGA